MTNEERAELIELSHVIPELLNKERKIQFLRYDFLWFKLFDESFEKGIRVGVNRAIQIMNADQIF